MIWPPLALDFLPVMYFACWERASFVEGRQGPISFLVGRRRERLGARPANLVWGQATKKLGLSSHLWVGDATYAHLVDRRADVYVRYNNACCLFEGI